MFHHLFRLRSSEREKGDSMVEIKVEVDVFVRIRMPCIQYEIFIFSSRVDKACVIDV